MSTTGEKKQKALEFQAMCGLSRVYQPKQGATGAQKKHPCPDCHFCQLCSDVRCQSCRKSHCGPPSMKAANRSVREQIALFEQINIEPLQTPITEEDSGNRC